MRLLQLSSAQGPDECCLAVALALKTLVKEAEGYSLTLSVIDSEAGSREGTFRSVLVSVAGEQANIDRLAQRWQGSLQWVCQSPFRPHHSRKNWFIGVNGFALPAPVAEGEIRFDALRSSGPGGQHVNKTDSAIRATHLATGMSVKVQSERSQHANKRLAQRLLAHKLAQLAQQADRSQRAERRMSHHRLECGNANLVFKGIHFVAVNN